MGKRRWQQNDTYTKTGIARSLVCCTDKTRCRAQRLKDILGEGWWYIPIRIFQRVTDVPLDLLAMVAANNAVVAHGMCGL